MECDVFDGLYSIGVLRGRGRLGRSGCFGTTFNEKRLHGDFLGEFLMPVNGEKETMSGFFCPHRKRQCFLSM